MQVRWGQGRDRAGSPTHQKTSAENHLETHLSLNRNGLWCPNNQRQKLEKCRNSIYNSSSLRFNHTPTHTHPPSATSQPLSTLQHWVISQSMFGFPELQTWQGERDQKETQPEQRGWVETMLCKRRRKSNLEIFFWPRVKRMILLCDESLEFALHDRKEKSGRNEWGERRHVRHTYK